LASTNRHASLPTEAANRANELKFLISSGDRLTEVAVPFTLGEPRPRLVSASPGEAEYEVEGKASFHDIFEVGMPFERLGLMSGSPVSLAVQVLRQGVEVERLPRNGYLSFTVPDEDYERKNWKV
jgi:hypothetical protein